MTRAFKESVDDLVAEVSAAAADTLDRLFYRWQEWMYGRGSARMIKRQMQPPVGAWLDYLERFYLLQMPRRLFSMFLHCFYLDDPDPLHDHKWAWGRVILSGRYREHYLDGTFKDCGPGHVVWRRDRMVLHRVELLSDRVWTLFWHWRKVRPWGFLDLRNQWVSAESLDAAEKRPTVGFIFPRKV